MRRKGFMLKGTKSNAAMRKLVLQMNTSFRKYCRAKIKRAKNVEVCRNGKLIKFTTPTKS